MDPRNYFNGWKVSWFSSVCLDRSSNSVISDTILFPIIALSLGSANEASVNKQGKYVEVANGLGFWRYMRRKMFVSSVALSYWDPATNIFTSSQRSEPSSCMNFCHCQVVTCEYGKATFATYFSLQYFFFASALFLFLSSCFSFSLLYFPSLFLFIFCFVFFFPSSFFSHFINILH
jgi:hypothetical protein